MNDTTAENNFNKDETTKNITETGNPGDNSHYGEFYWFFLHNFYKVNFNNQFFKGYKW